MIRLFAAWPAEWDADFTLRARGAFVVTAAQGRAYRVCRNSLGGWAECTGAEPVGYRWCLNLSERQTRAAIERLVAGVRY